MNLLFLLSLVFLTSCQMTKNKKKQVHLSNQLQQYSKAFFKQKRKIDFQTFVISSEIEIGKAMGIIKQAQPGSFFSVGSELAFRALSMMPKVEIAFLADLDPKLIRFNKINSQLLKAKSLELYRNLRWDSSYKEWTQISSQLTQDDFLFWQTHVRDIYRAPYYLPEMLNRFENDRNYQTYQKVLKHCLTLKKKKNTSKKVLKSKIATCLEQYPHSVAHILNQKEADWFKNIFLKEEWSCFKEWKNDYSLAVNMSSVMDFKTGNYLFDKVLYQKLHKLAINGKIISFQADLNDHNFILGLSKILIKNGVKITFFDFDNLYFKDYLGQDSYHKLIKDISPIADKKAIVLAMSNYKWYACGQYQTYFGFDFSFLKDWNYDFKIQDYISLLSPETMGHMNGKIYNKLNLPPYFQ